MQEMFARPAQLLSLFIACLAIPACSSSEGPLFLSGSGDEEFIKRKDHLIAKAKDGHANSAYELSIGYDLYLRGPKRSSYWLRRAARLGYSGVSDLIKEQKLAVKQGVAELECPR